MLVNNVFVVLLLELEFCDHLLLEKKRTQKVGRLGFMEKKWPIYFWHILLKVWVGGSRITQKPTYLWKNIIFLYKIFFGGWVAKYEMNQTIVASWKMPSISKLTIAGFCVYFEGVKTIINWLNKTQGILKRKILSYVDGTYGKHTKISSNGCMSESTLHGIILGKTNVLFLGIFWGQLFFNFI